MHLSGDLLERCRGAAALAVGGQIDRDAPYRAAEALDDRPPAAAVERQSVQEDDWRASAFVVEGEPRRRVCCCCHHLPPLNLFRNVVP